MIFMMAMATLVANPAAMLQVASLGAAQTQLMPLIFAALLLDFAIVVAWYLIGVLLSNASVKQSAKGELYQFVSTAILVLIIIAVLYIAATVFTQTFGIRGPLGTFTITGLCSSLQNAPDFLAPGAILTHPINICQQTADPSQSGDITTEINYPLAAIGVITGYQSYQMEQDLNATYIIDSYMRFLMVLSPTMGGCAQGPNAQDSSHIARTPPVYYPLVGGQYALYPLNLAPCTPRPTAINYTFYVKISSAPYSGYNMLAGSLGTLATLMSTAIGIFLAEGLMTSIMLFIWPWLLFAGIALRATPFTRRLGGLLIAIAIAAVLIYPTLFAMELLSVSGTQSNPFNFPSAQLIAEGVQNGCWPAGGSLLTQESVDIAYLSSIGAPLSTVWTAISGSQAGIQDIAFAYAPNSFIPLTCTPTAALNTVFDLFNAYGELGVTGFFLPILNLIITLAAVRALSGLLGGDTDLAGLSKLF